MTKEDKYINSLGNPWQYQGIEGWIYMPHTTISVEHGQHSFTINAYFEQNAGDPIVLIHGLIGSNSFFSEQNIRQLAKLGPVYSICLPGHPHTRSPVPFPKTDKKLFAETIAAQVKALSKGRKVVLIGHSTGATAALACAIEFPELISKVVVCDGSSNGRETNGIFRFLQTLVLKGGAIGAAIFKSIFWFNGANLWVNKQFMLDLFSTKNGIYQYPYMWHTRARYFKDLKQLNYDIMKQMFVDLDSLDLEPELAKISCPVLVLVGDRDVFIPMYEAEKIASQIPNAKLNAIANCGHVPFFEHPLIWEKAIAEFVLSEH
jgi:pimeloyl-ACP methyl ester carboxylesterase